VMNFMTSWMTTKFSRSPPHGVSEIVHQRQREYLSDALHSRSWWSRGLRSPNTDVCIYHVLWHGAYVYCTDIRISMSQLMRHMNIYFYCTYFTYFQSCLTWSIQEPLPAQV
jgi:hypothetical protein